MTSAEYTLLSRIVEREGGVADVGDGKGVTRYGQTPGWLAEFSLPSPQNANDAILNYSQWLDMTGLSRIVGPVADDLADIVIDIAVMSDHHKGIKALQAALQQFPDGVFGPVTAAALARADRKQLARDVIAWDMQYQGRLITLDSTRAKFAAGWANRMAEHVRNLA